MEKPEPNREELISQIADVVGKAKPLPPMRDQIISAVTSALIRLGCIAYSAYLSSLFISRFMLVSDTKTTSIDAGDLVLMVAAISFIGFLVFRKVGQDRFTPVKEFFQAALLRVARIVLAFLFYMWLFSNSRWLANSDLWRLLASFFILNAGYDFRLSVPRRPKNLPDA